MNSKFPKSGLYVITKTGKFSPQQIIDSVSAAIRGGAKIIQYRDKTNINQSEVANELLTVCRKSGIPLIINDNISLAARIGADGVHLGQEDGDIQTAKTILGPRSIVGISCYASLERAKAAQEEGAAYVAFGRFFPSKSKPAAPVAGLNVLREAGLQIPIVAIGGITPKNGRKLLEAGADLLAVIDAVCGRQNPEQSAYQFKMLFNYPE